ncbi:hypothetical protein LSTR_LSTR004177 [Laodelphax striatellus]|uniref:Uncharacterized protein n=1 Tax=Laodelphax striatellus TaxID=195883 RepID=A0A482X9M1_LAOST|nr:hypothetical protein LSTR_LSTR004177 [Laodelphax striatellus]
MDQYVGSLHDILVQSILLHFPTICTNDILSHIPELDQYVGSMHDILVQFPYIPSLSTMCTSDILSHIPEMDQSMKRHSVPKMGQNVAGPTVVGTKCHAPVSKADERFEVLRKTDY